MIAAVLDTGIFVRAALGEGRERWLVSLALNGQMRLVHSRKASAELEQVMKHPEILSLTHWTSRETEAFVRLVERAADLHHDPSSDGNDPIAALAVGNNVPLVTSKSRVDCYGSNADVIEFGLFCDRVEKLVSEEELFT